MFKEGNLVRLITEDGDGEVMEVVVDSDDESGITNCRIGNSVNDHSGLYGTKDLELVTTVIRELEAIPTRPNVNSLDEEEIHSELNKYIISVISSLRDKGCVERISINIACEHYGGKEEVDILYGVTIKYGDRVESDSLGKSAFIAWQREKENEELKVKAIPFRVETKL